MRGWFERPRRALGPSVLVVLAIAANAEARFRSGGPIETIDLQDTPGTFDLVDPWQPRAPREWLAWTPELPPESSSPETPRANDPPATEEHGTEPLIQGFLVDPWADKVASAPAPHATAHDVTHEIVNPWSNMPRFQNTNYDLHEIVDPWQRK